MSRGNRGRPRSFDEEEVLDRAVEVFWRHDVTSVTTRLLEGELGLSQSSLYNAFGSKAELRDRALDRYEARLSDELVAPLRRDDADRATVIEFIDGLVRWVADDRRRGCLLLNHTIGAAHGDLPLSERATRYRDGLRSALQHALSALDPTSAAVRAELVLAGAIGLSATARSGASRGELDAIADALRMQIDAW